MAKNDSWTGTVTGKSRALLDGANMYRRVTVRTDTGATRKTRVDRPLWKELQAGDRLVKERGHKPRRP
ncbi:hypothetical protein PQI66_08705 [Corynebacterium sp. USCH3]|uniref:DUF7489 domain-containing protein n=1 Tax=Corynebacterium sp. USCH3 TaxID=3024840 RepID=UPI0030B0746B